MAIFLVTYDLKQPGRNYAAVYEYLRGYSFGKGPESVWFLDTPASATRIRDDLIALVDENDRIFVGRLRPEWGSLNLPCPDWLNAPERSW